MFTEDALLPISALQHLLFCERQCALIHVEGVWAENRRTIEGRHLHEQAHGGPDQTRVGVRTVRGLPLRSLRLGLFGIADVVEFHACNRSAEPSHGPPETASGATAEATPFPVEYKRGRPKRNDCDRVQLCAQAMCLQEMRDVEVPAGALFYGRTRRRFDVAFDGALRRRTEDTAVKLHALIAAGRTPLARREPKCKHCSLLHLCIPGGLKPARSASLYLRQALKRALQQAPTSGGPRS